MREHSLNQGCKTIARPLSNEKREALLASAARLVAVQGTDASTAKIAKDAGVAEGTLFTYFATKDELLNALFAQIETSLAEAMLAVPVSGGSREQIRLIWERLIAWGLANPIWRKAIRRLKLSGRVTPENERRCEAKFGNVREIAERSLAGHVDPRRAAFYIKTILFALADTTMEAIEADPSGHAHFSEAGFDLFWKGAAA
ncbi:MAG TPA: TetR/AcrR family transcriptional regulator [Allosphingosinicella sp.]|nr:TetR/AcrR family transcriptional regulator [Allosphingosinicella sp.]